MLYFPNPDLLKFGFLVREGQLGPDQDLEFSVKLDQR